MTAVWDQRLWDTFNPQLYSFTKYNQDFVKHYSDFLERRGKIEEKYAKDLRKLCKEYKPKEFDIKKEKFKFSLQSAFEEMLVELNSLANQHDTLRDEVMRSAKEMKETLKTYQREFQQTERQVASLSKNLDKSRSQLESVRQNYHRAFADMRKARDDYTTNKDNKDITKNEEERFQQVYLQKQSQFEDRKNGYAKELTDFNNSQRAHYTQLLPEQLLVLQEQERRLVATCQQHFQTFGDAELRSLDIQTKCAQTMRAKADTASADADIQEFLRVTASGNQVPADLPFEELGSNDNIVSSGARKSGRANKFDTLKGRSLGPAQQKRRLEEQLRDKDQELEKAAKEVDALKKLMDTYRQNPKIGDASAVEQQVQQASEKLAKLHEERTELLKELDSLGVEVGNLVAPPASVQPQPTAEMRAAPAANVFADEFDDAAPPRPPAPGAAATAAAATAPAPSPTPAAPAPAPAPELPVGAMMYDFNDPSQPDNLSVVAGERLHILERDPDWTLVRRLHGNTSEQGYVPTAYMAEEP